MIVETKCPLCNEVHYVECSEEGYKALRNGKLAQVALPDLSPEKREMLISGICPKCWDHVFPEED